MDPARPRASKMGILHGRIVGLDDDIDGLRADRHLDLDGRAVVPGFIDAQCHTSWFGLGLLDLSVEGCSTFQELYSSLAHAAETTPHSQWLIASGFDHKLCEVPDRDDSVPACAEASGDGADDALLAAGGGVEEPPS